MVELKLTMLVIRFKADLLSTQIRGRDYQIYLQKQNPPEYFLYETFSNSSLITLKIHSTPFLVLENQLSTYHQSSHGYGRRTYNHYVTILLCQCNPYQQSEHLSLYLKGSVVLAPHQGDFSLQHMETTAENHN